MAAGERLRGLQARLAAVQADWPWLLPLLSFLAGWASFFLAHRGETMARVVALLALLGWPWLLLEPQLGGWLQRISRGRLQPWTLRLVTQLLQQEILFFTLPFLLAACAGAPGPIAFVALVIAAALFATVDPLYHRRIERWPGLALALQGFCTFLAVLVVVPVALKWPLERALPAALLLTSLALLLGLPRLLRDTRGWRARILGAGLLVAVLAAVWPLRSQLPPAGLRVSEARLSTSLDGLEPGPDQRRPGAAALREQGLVAWVAVQAPQGLAQGLVFEWWHRGERLDRIPAEIHGQPEGAGLRGWRTYTRKRNWPADPSGPWRVDVRTPHGLLVSRLRFTVDG
ncbi:MAG TPA: DUF5924 family protein [Nevskiaceae bacterium]|nr:DUF5924 family protein [Nevskiaceae bacterium]